MDFNYIIEYFYIICDDVNGVCGLGVEKNSEMTTSYYEKGKDSLGGWQISGQKYKENVYRLK